MKLIYVLTHPLTGEVRYVGVTQRSLSGRLSSHVWESTHHVHRRTRRAKWIRSLSALGLRPEISAFASVVFAWQEVERAVIAQFRADGARLVNGTNGGEGTNGRVWSPNKEQRARMGAAQIGKRASPETRLKRSRSLRARYDGDPLLKAWRQELARRASRSPAARAAASARMKSIWADPEKTNAMRALMTGAKDRKAFEEMREILGE